uniref:Uncharacterized protein n=1 Tax=Zooxanthella nutricula TaxID=1333877 RepID=A0A7S2PZV5_9DINO
MAARQPALGSAKYGCSAALQSDGTVKASAQFQDDGSCCSCNCCVPDELRARTFAHAYDNRMVRNYPIAPFGCCTSQICIQDMVSTFFFDKPPFRSGPCSPPCCCIPAVCCGPPVIFSYKPMCCCVDLSGVCGMQVKFAPANYFGCRSFCCLGPPCYNHCSIPLLNGLKDADSFVSQLAVQHAQYTAQHGIPEGEAAIFEFVESNILLPGVELGGHRAAPRQLAMSQHVPSAPRA